MSAETELDDLAASISDGQEVNWNETAGGAPSRSHDATLWALRDVARIAEFNRGLQRSPLPGEGTSLGTPEMERWGHLSLLEPIGAGASGEVWRAWDPTLQREVALKFLLPRILPGGPSPDAPLIAEARAVARVRHPGIVVVHGIAEHDGRAGLWMELLHGPTLADEIERRGVLPAGEVVRVGLELCRALGALAEARVVHGDLKPANVILEPGGRVVLTDFGLGRRRAPDDSDARRLTGTPFFMSPELLTGNSSTPRSDLYALGVTLRWALTGKPPFRARSLDELKAEAATGPAVPLVSERPDAPRRLVQIIDRAMASDPAARFAGASEMAAALIAVTDAVDVKRPSTRLRVAMGVAAVLALIVAAAWLKPRFSGVRSPGETGIDASRDLTGGTTSKQPAGSTTSGQPAGGAASDQLAGGAVSAGLEKAGALPPAASVSYDVQATFLGNQGDGFRRLSPGDRVAPGDWLALEFKASKPMWVYVLNQDEQGETYLLFPQPLFDAGNPISPDAPVTLPGTIGGRENAWQVTSRGGREHFLVVASPSPVPEIEQELKRIPEAKPGRPIQYAPVTTATVERLRGVGGVATLPAGAMTSPQGAFERFQALAGRETVTQGVWVRKITLENPVE